MVASAPRLRLASDGPGCRQGSIYGQGLFDDQLHSLTRRQIAGDDAALNRSVAGIRHKTSSATMASALSNAAATAAGSWFDGLIENLRAWRTALVGGCEPAYKSGCETAF